MRAYKKMAVIALATVLGLGGFSGVGPSAQAQGFARGEIHPPPRHRPYYPPDRGHRPYFPTYWGSWHHGHGGHGHGGHGHGGHGHGGHGHGGTRGWRTRRGTRWRTPLSHRVRFEWPVQAEEILTRVRILQIYPIRAPPTTDHGRGSGAGPRPQQFQPLERLPTALQARGGAGSPFSPREKVPRRGG